METPNTRSKNKSIQKDGNNTATIARNRRHPPYINTIQKFVVKYLVCGCAINKMSTLTIPDVVPSPDQDAQMLRKAFKVEGWGTDEKAVIGVMGHRNASQRKRIREVYQRLYNKSLIDALISELSGDFGILVGLVSSYRYDEQAIDHNIVVLDATKLRYLVTKNQLEDDEMRLILTTRSFFRLKATFESYQKSFNKSIIEDIASCGDGDLPALLKIAVICIVCPEKHFAEVIRASIVGLGTDEDSLMRAIVSRAEVDMTKIKEVYSEVNKESLEDAMVRDTSRDYKNFLLTLLGAKH